MKRPFVAGALLAALLVLGGCGGEEHSHGNGGHSHGETASDERAHDAGSSDEHAHDEGEADDHAHGDDEGDADDHAHGDDESWAVTSWGEHFEIFAEADPLVADQVSRSHTHVTLLEGFRPVRQGTVSVVLRAPGGSEQVFTQDRALRDGIFDVEIVPGAMGEFELLFRVEAAGFREDVRSGHVIVGSPADPGGHHDHGEDGPSVEEVSFLKEQQWKTPFATAWVEEGRIHESARGTGRVRPAAGGELHLAAPIDGLVVSDPWPYVGLVRPAGEPVLALSSRVSQGRTLAELQALQTEKSAELELARERLTRLEGLLEVGAVSSAEVDAARTRVQTLAAQSESARRQMASVRGSVDSEPGGNPVLEVTAPFTGEVAEVLVSPGQAVSAGDPLVRMVRLQPVWVEVHLAPRDAQRLEDGVSGLWVRATGDRERTRFEEEQVRLVSIAPEVSARTGRVTGLLQVDTAVSHLRLGSALEAEVLLAEAREGIVIPASAIVDDAGIPTVFVQLDGETFERREVTVLGREGDHFLVDGLRVGERLVTTGGSAIRRASLISSGGADHGHVH